MNFEEITATVAGEFKQVDEMIMDELHSNVSLIGEIGNYIVSSGGKRLRPLVSLLSAGAFGYTEGEKHIKIATITEFLHTATLLHDDVVDESNLRRGNPTVNAVWGNATSVLVGDFLISRSFQLIVSVKHMRLMEILAEATNLIAEGEVLQLINVNKPETSEEQYMEVIRYKTAKMFEVAAISGPIVAKAGHEAEDAMVDYARHMGAAFQITDDVLDYTSSAEEMGKNVGDDLAEGKPTLPLIYAMQHGTPEQTKMIETAIKTGGLEKLDEIIAAVKSSGALDYTIKKAEEESALAIKALDIVPESKYRTALESLANLAVHRSS